MATESQTIILPTAASANALDEFHLDFQEDEQAEKPITEETRLYWFNGLATTEGVMAIGWHLKAGINPYLDETLEGMGVQRYLVQHGRPGKDGKTDPVPYWPLRTCSLIVVARRIQSTMELYKSVEDRFGIAYALETIRDEQGVVQKDKKGQDKRHSVLKLRAYIHELYTHGWANWVPLTITGNNTKELLAAFNEQYRVLEAYGDMRRGQGKSPIAPYYLFSLPLTAGQMKYVGEPPEQGKIYPIVAQVPKETISRDYLAQHFVPQLLVEEIRHTLLDETVLWSMEESVRIAQGKSDQGGPLLLTEGSAASEKPAHPAPVPAAKDDVVTPAQLQWILSQYCGGNEEALRQICAHFNVTSPEQLRASHYQMLVATATQAAQSSKKAKK